MPSAICNTCQSLVHYHSGHLKKQQCQCGSKDLKAVAGATRTKGFVIARKALSVRVNGYCVTHLDCDKKPFPVHYHVGWCQGKDELLTAFLNERRIKQ